MEWVSVVIGIVSQLAILGLIVWAIVRAVGGRGERVAAADQAASVKRLFVYGLLFATLILTAVGAVFVLQELTGPGTDETDDDRSLLAFGLALVMVAGPTYGLLLHSARRGLEHTVERQSFSWAAYLNLSLLVSLIVTTVSAQQMLEGVTGVDDFSMESVAPVAVWGTVWATHWFWLKAAYGLPGDLHLAAGSLTGLITLASGVGGLAFVAGDEIYTRIVERVPAGHGDPELWSWIIAAFIGALVWSWYWLGHYLSARPTQLWHVYVVLIGALGGLLAAMGSAAAIAYWLLVWFLGNPSEALSSEHFEYVPAAAAVLLVGAASWQYHRSVLQRHEVERREPLRAYDYLMAATGLVGSVVGVTLVLVALIEAITPEPVSVETHVANMLILAATLITIGGPLWWFFWSRIEGQVTADPARELASIVRRIYLIVLFGVGGIVVLASLISVLFIGLDELLDGTFGTTTVRSFRVALSLLVTVTGVAWYHLRVFRSDRDHLASVKPALPPRPRRHVVLVAPPGTALADELAMATGAELDSWYRTDEITMPDIDVDELATRVEASDASNVLVVVGAAGPILVPFDT